MHAKPMGTRKRRHAVMAVGPSYGDGDCDSAEPLGHVVPRRCSGINTAFAWVAAFGRYGKSAMPAWSGPPGAQRRAKAGEGRCILQALQQKFEEPFGFRVPSVLHKGHQEPRCSAFAVIVGHGEHIDYFNAPAVSPDTIWRCKTTNSKTIGNTNSAANAMTRCQSAISVPMKL